MSWMLSKHKLYPVKLKYGGSDNAPSVSLDIPLTKREIMEVLDKKGIKYNARDKKEVLEKLLGGD